MLFEIDCLDEKGIASTRCIKASSPDEALTIAKAMGVYVTGIRKTTEDALRNEESRQHGDGEEKFTKRLAKQKNAEAIHSVFIALGIALGTVVVVLGAYFRYQYLAFSVPDSPPQASDSNVEPFQPSSPEYKSPTVTASNLWVGKSLTLSREIVGAKESATLLRIVELLRDNDEKAFATLVVRGDAIRIRKGERATVVAFSPNGQVVRIRPDGNPDDYWVLGVWLSE